MSESAGGWAGGAISDVLQHQLFVFGLLRTSDVVKSQLVCKTWKSIARDISVSINVSSTPTPPEVSLLSYATTVSVHVSNSRRFAFSDAVAAALESNTSLQRLTLSGKLSLLDAKVDRLLAGSRLSTLVWGAYRHHHFLIDCIENVKSIREVSIRGPIAGENIKRLFSALSSSAISSIEISEGYPLLKPSLQQARAGALAGYIRHAKCLKKFSLSSGDGDEALVRIARALKRHGKLEEIRLTTAASEASLSQIEKMVARNSDLRCFSLVFSTKQSPKSTDPPMSLHGISTALSRLKFLESVELVERFCELSPAVISCPNLTRLRLEELDRESALALGEALSRNQTIVSLIIRFRSGPSSGDDKKSFFDFLTVNTTLSNLSPAHSRLSNIDWKSLARGLKINNTLSLLDLSHCVSFTISAEEADRINRRVCRGLRGSQSLHTVSLSFFPGDIFLRMAEVISRTKTIAFIDLTGCKIFPSYIAPIASALRENTSLVSFESHGYTGLINSDTEYDPIRQAACRPSNPIRVILPGALSDDVSSIASDDESVASSSYSDESGSDSEAIDGESSMPKRARRREKGFNEKSLAEFMLPDDISES